MQSAPPTVLVVYSGGTFGMRETARGLAPDPTFPGILRSMMQDLLPSGPTASLDAAVVEVEEAIDSSNAGPETAPRLAEFIRTSASRFDRLAGVIVIHGTDTLAYSAARLAFELHDLPAPVVITGSQLPYGAPHSDARDNLTLALEVVRSSRYVTGCWVAFAGRVLPATRATKYSSTSLDGFRASMPLAPGAKGVPALPAAGGSSPARVVSLRFSPGTIAADLVAFQRSSPDGVILETYGAGNAPISRDGMREALRILAENRPVVAISQCMTGGVQLGRYAPGHELAALGVIDGADLTLEAALAKLGFLLDRSVSRGQLGPLMRQNFVGECQSAGVA